LGGSGAWAENGAQTMPGVHSALPTMAQRP
jgi:hypothetical protein